MAKKYYVVWEGLEKGIFNSWDKCKKVISGVKNAKYKSFDDLEMAEKAFKGVYEDYKGKKIETKKASEKEHLNVGEPNMNSIAVDAACSGNPGTMYYRGIDLNAKKILFEQGPFEYSTNNIGEFLALVHAIALLKQNNDPRPIYSDSKIAISWVKQKKYKTQLTKNENNKKSFELLERAQKWLQENNYTTQVLKWQTSFWGEIPADYGNKK
ncbi:MAG: ribonuclease H family protein [Capnocytophaga sp.]|nr:ribonuclease H family protein [Capnocytophaga sp.]